MADIRMGTMPPPPPPLKASIASMSESQGKKQGPLAGPAAALYAELFEAIDSDGSGFLDEATGKQFLRCSGCAEAELDYYWADLVRSADTDSDGRIEKFKNPLMYIGVYYRICM